MVAYVDLTSVFQVFAHEAVGGVSVARKSVTGEA